MANRNPWQARLKQHENRWPVDIQRLQAEAYGALMVAREGVAVEDDEERRKNTHVYFTALSIFVKLMESVEWGSITSRLALLETDRQFLMAARQSTPNDADEVIDLEVEDDLPEAWERTVEQAILRGTMTEVEQSLALHVLPPPNKMLVLSQSLATIGQPRAVPVVTPVVVRAPAPEPAPTPPRRDPEQDRLDSLEAEVRTLVNGLKRTIPPPATPPGHLG